MKLSTRARYALRMMVALARSTDEENLLSLSRVSKEAMVSRRYLEQLVIGLKHADLIRGKSGKGGGYTLAQPAKDIKLRQIVESAIGPINIVECVMKPEVCLRSDTCECRMLYRLINHQITKVLDSMALSDLADGKGMKDLVAALDNGALDDAANLFGEPCDHFHKQ